MVGGVEVEITCDGFEPPVSFLCSFSGGPVHLCELSLLFGCIIMPSACTSAHGGLGRIANE